MKKIVALQFLLLWNYIAFSQLTTDELRRNLLKSSSGSVMVAAHRGAHAKFPENSVGAIKEAIRLKVDIVEIDVKVSKDGVPFLMHDRTMDRTTTGKGDPELFTWEELQQFNIVDTGSGYRGRKLTVRYMHSLMVLLRGLQIWELNPNSE
jgi:glycerophosphoryl diester phosphodiesterase